MRRLTPELLDSLPPEDPAAVAGRRDLRVINFILGNERRLARALVARLRPEDDVVEIGAGEGGLARKLARWLPPGWNGTYTAIDLAPRPAGWPADGRFHWLQEDILTSARVRSARVVVANLILHHFTDDQLRHFGSQLAAARLFLACEPARRRPWMRFGLYVLGLHPLTKHDMRVSIEAGFLGSELADTLGLAPDRWRRTVRTGCRGIQTLVAERRAE